MDNKRSLKRRELLYNFTVFDTDADEQAGFLVDVCAQGLKISGPTAFAPGQQLELAIELPEEILGRTKIRCSAKVQWSRPDLNPDLFATGLQFVFIAPDDLETLVGLMARFSMN
jgi:hypothetical protein